MKKIKRKKRGPTKSKQTGGAILFTIVVASLIGLVGIVNIAIINFINIHDDDEKIYLEEIAMVKNQRDLLMEENSRLYSRENIFKLLNENQIFSKDSLFLAEPIDTIKVRFWFGTSLIQEAPKKIEDSYFWYIFSNDHFIH